MKKIVIIPGGFHPFHAGHKALYDAAVAAFPSADVYVAATADTSTRPFPFEVKQKLAQLAGIPAHRFIQVKSPFQAKEITQHFDPNSTVLIFARSEKDKDSQPKPGGIKKDGTPAYLQPYKRNGLEPMSKHGYMAYLPTVQFGPGMTSATEIRSKWPEMSPEQKANLVHALYPATDNNDQLTSIVVRMLNQVMGGATTEGLAGAALGGLAGAALTKPPMGAIRGASIGSKIQNTLTGNQEVDEASMVNDPERGIEIRPDGGMGSYSPDALTKSVNRHLVDAMEQLKLGNFDKVEYMLYQWGVLENKVRALQQYYNFMTKQGRRPIAKGREVDLTPLSEDYIDEKSKK